MGRELAIGDFVVLPDRWGSKSLELAKVLGFTPKKVRVGFGRDFLHKHLTEGNRMCRLPAEEVMMYLLAR